jgi:HK97 family phage prohead protease
MKTIRTECGRILRSAGSGNRSLPGVISTGEVARDDHKVDPNNWIYPPTVPFVDSHLDHTGIRTVLGKVSDIRVGNAELDDGRSVRALLGTVNYAPGDVNPDAEVAYQLAVAGYATGLSVSFIPRSWTYATDRGPRAMNVSSAELLEVSCVAVPSDTNAKVLARAVRAHIDGLETREDRRVLAKAIRERCRLDDTAHEYGYLWR